MGEDGEYRLAGGALDAPDGETTQTDPRVMGVAGQTPAARTGRLVGELKAQGKDEGEDKLDKRLAIADQLEVGGWVLEIDSDGAVFSYRFGRCAPVLPLCHQVLLADETQWG